MDGTETRTPLQKQKSIMKVYLPLAVHYPFIPYLSAIAMHIYAKSCHSEEQIPVNSFFFCRDSHNTYSPSQTQVPHQRPPPFQTRLPGDLLILSPFTCTSESPGALLQETLLVAERVPLFLPHCFHEQLKAVQTSSLLHCFRPGVDVSAAHTGED